MNKEEFFDKRHDKVADRYYDIACEGVESMETRNDVKKLIKELKKLIKIDPSFLDSYSLAAKLHRDLNDEKKATELEEKAYNIALKTMRDSQGNWPGTIEWGWLENRHIVRAINGWAYNLWHRGKTNEALEIFRKLLKSNLNDNVGARYSILAIRLGLNHDYDEEFAHPNGHGLDVGKTLKWWDKNYKKFPDEFTEWQKYIDEMD